MKVTSLAHLAILPGMPAMRAVSPWLGINGYILDSRKGNSYASNDVLAGCRQFSQFAGRLRIDPFTRRVRLRRGQSLQGPVPVGPDRRAEYDKVGSRPGAQEAAGDDEEGFVIPLPLSSRLRHNLHCAPSKSHRGHRAHRERELWLVSLKIETQSVF